MVDAAAGGARVGGVVGHQHHREPPRPGAVEDDLPDAIPQTRVEPRERLVEEQRPRLREQHPHQRDPHPLPAGQRGRIAVRESREVHLGEGRLHPAAAFAPAARRGREPEGEVAAHREMREQQLVLEQDAHPPRLRRETGDVASIETNPAPDLEDRRRRAGDDRQEGGLAGPRRAHDGEHVARRDGAVEGDQAGLSQGDRQAVEAESRRVSHRAALAGGARAPAARRRPARTGAGQRPSGPGHRRR